MRHKVTNELAVRLGAELGFKAGEEISQNPLFAIFREPAIEKATEAARAVAEMLPAYARPVYLSGFSEAMLSKLDGLAQGSKRSILRVTFDNKTIDLVSENHHG